MLGRCPLYASSTHLVHTTAFHTLAGLLVAFGGAVVAAIRDVARREPERPAHEVLEADVLAIVAALTNQSPTEMTTHALRRSQRFIEARSVR